MTAPRATQYIGLLAQLRQDHLNVAMLLEMIESELAAFDAGEDPDYELMFDIMHYLANYQDQIHHPNEDLLFQRLLDRDMTLRPTVEALFAEHEQLAQVGHDLQMLLEQIVGDAFVERAVLHERLEAYLNLFKNHIGTEEREVYPGAERALGSRDWVVLNAEFVERADPLFGDIIAHEYQAIAERMTP